MISCYKGLAPVSFPAEWAEGFDYDASFAHENGRAQIYFRPAGRAFEVWLTYGEEFAEVYQHVRELSSEEIEKIAWGAFCDPWESYQTAMMFGHNDVIRIDE
jgi:hypothetical protein